jgi:hypothetical protein
MLRLLQAIFNATAENAPPSCLSVFSLPTRWLVSAYLRDEALGILTADAHPELDTEREVG